MHALTKHAHKHMYKYAQASSLYIYVDGVTNSLHINHETLSKTSIN